MNSAFDLSQIKGFLDPDEGQALHDVAVLQAELGPCLEIGGYCGKSAIYIGRACAAANELLFSVDHHRGSEEHQPEWSYFDRDLWDETAQAVDTLPYFRAAVRAAGLEDVVVPVVGRSAAIAARWRTPLSFVFIDGSHVMENALADYRGWTPHLMEGGMLAIHDVFPDPKDGGRPPFDIYQRALRSDLFAEVLTVKSLKLLKRL